MKKAIHAFLVVGFITISPWAPASSQQLEIHTIDVGQGASELLIGPNGTTVLVDGGGSSKGPTELLPYLNSIFPPGSRTLDYVIASHDDSDHYGGLNYILDNGYSANTIYHCGYNSGFGRGVPIPIGTVIDLGGGARVTCVLVNGYLIDGTRLNVGTGNTASIGLLIEYGDFDYITAGDLTSTKEGDFAQVLVTYINPPDHPYHPNEPYLDPQYGVDVIHSNHHGSAGSTSTDYVNILRCEMAFVNGGTGYGHPTKDAVDRLLGRQYYTCSCCGSYGEPTGVTVPGAEVYRTTPEPDPGDPDCRRATEEDCPTIGDMLIVYDGGQSYSIEGTSMGVSYRNVDEVGGPPPPTPTPSPTPSGPFPTPTLTPMPTWSEQVAYTSFEEPQATDPIGYTLSGINGSVPDNPGSDEWGRWATTPRTDSYSFAARDCSNVGRCTFNSVDVSGYTGVVVHLWLKTIGTFEGGDYARAYVRVDGQDKPYFLNETESALNSHGYEEHTYNVADGSSSIVIIYEVRDSSNGEYVYIDDIEVTADQPPTATPTVTSTPTITQTPTITPTPTPWAFPRRVNFQSYDSQIPEGYVMDDGSLYGAYREYGWK